MLLASLSTERAEPLDGGDAQSRRGAPHQSKERAWAIDSRGRSRDEHAERLLDSNVSLMDEDSFVYHLVSPFESYPRALEQPWTKRLWGRAMPCLFGQRTGR